MTFTRIVVIFLSMPSLHPDFDLVSETELPEYRGRGLRFRHRATGCEVFHLVCGDEENTFAFGFRTPSRDSTGSAHIVEHSVLCGSERYPVRDPFLVMARRSLATYLNALTYPDRTVYPASSAVEADYFNLMSVYGDAVFFPLLTEDTFLQEGHRLQEDAEGRLERAGVVYNEMRGDYSSADSLTATRAVQSLFEEGHPYSWDSGGDPAVIPELDYGRFVDFWARHYNPSNCRVFLYGNIDTARQLAFLADNFLSRRNPRWIRAEGSGGEAGDRVQASVGSQAGGVADVPLAPRFKEPRRLVIPCPPEGGGEGTTSIIVNWLLPALDAPGDSLAAELLAELLVGHDGAPLSLALRGSGLGEDLSPQSGLDMNFREPIFSIGLRGTDEGREGQIEELIAATLRDFAASAPDAEALDAAFHSIAFANREIRRGSGTYGTRLMSRAFRSWIRGGNPEEGLSFALPLERLKARIDADPTYIPSLARTWLLDNPHRSTLTSKPDPSVFEGEEKIRRERLEGIEAGLSAGDRATIVSRAAALEAAQSTPDAPELVATLPRLRVRDIPREIDVVPREALGAAGRPLSYHPLFTNGIVYLDLAFPLDRIGREASVWLPFMSRFLGGAGLPGLPWDRTAALLARHSGGFGVVLESGTPVGPGPWDLRSAATGNPSSSWAIFRLKALSERFPEALDLVVDLLTKADSSDRKRVGDLFAELGNDVISALVPSGSGFALTRAGATWSAALELDDRWRGMGQFSFLRALRDRDVTAEAAAMVDGLRGAIAAREGLLVNLTADRPDLPGALAALERSLARLPESPLPLPGSPAPVSGGAPALHEGYIVASQVGFASAACPSSRLGSAGYAHESVLSHLLTTGPLWDELRVKRGAYGASCHLDPLEGVAFFSTYRDPRPADSLDFFGEALEAVAVDEALDEEKVEEAVVGTAGKELRPLLPEERGFADFRRELFGIGDDLRRSKRLALLGTGPAELKAAAARLAAALKGASSVLISRADDVQLSSRRRQGTRQIDLSK